MAFEILWGQVVDIQVGDYVICPDGSMPDNRPSSPIEGAPDAPFVGPVFKVLSLDGNYLTVEIKNPVNGHVTQTTLDPKLISSVWRLVQQ